jgi:hypothetical protein
MSEVFNKYRQRLLKAATEALALSGHGKHYEGRVETIRRLGGIHDPDQVEWGILVHCYVLGPQRHYTFIGRTLDECVASADAALTEWIADGAKTRGA